MTSLPDEEGFIKSVLTVISFIVSFPFLFAADLLVGTMKGIL